MMRMLALGLFGVPRAAAGLSALLPEPHCVSALAGFDP
jgi:hypothetical protein